MSSAIMGIKGLYSHLSKKDLSPQKTDVKALAQDGQTVFELDLFGTFHATIYDVMLKKNMTTISLKTVPISVTRNALKLQTPVSILFLTARARPRMINFSLTSIHPSIDDFRPGSDSDNDGFTRTLFMSFSSVAFRYRTESGSDEASSHLSPPPAQLSPRGSQMARDSVTIDDALNFPPKNTDWR
ncbi:hypothetical protein BGZ79_005288 [Entomortierella chlamydospora]|nr:hypothetical protein BGZ79_005288 [Entomortierella chlamydospora]